MSTRIGTRLLAGIPMETCELRLLRCAFCRYRVYSWHSKLSSPARAHVIAPWHACALTPHANGSPNANQGCIHPRGTSRHVD